MSNDKRPGLTIFQAPNIPLAAALIAAAASYFVTGWAHSFAQALFYLAIAAWSYGEITHGANWFRRSLGIAIALYMLISLARALHR